MQKCKCTAGVWIVILYLLSHEIIAVQSDRQIIYLYTQIGKTVLLECFVLCHNHSSVNWHRKTNEMQEHESISIKNKINPNFAHKVVAKNECLLEIKNITRNDDGKYSCFLQDITNVNGVDVYLIVTDNPKYILTVDQQATELYEGENVTLLCNISSAYGEYVMWTKKGFEQQQRGSKYQIINLNLNDSGVYSCTVGNVTVQTLLNFAQKPMCRRPFMVKIEGEISKDIELTVDYYSYPECDEVKWFKDDKTIVMLPNNTKIRKYEKNETTRLKNKVDNKILVCAVSLYLQNLRDDNFGQYTALIQNERGFCKCEIQLSAPSKHMSPLEMYILVTGSATVFILVVALLYPKCQKLC